MTKAEQIQAIADKAKAEIDAVVAKKTKKPSKWEPKPGDCYWYIASGSNVEASSQHGHTYGNARVLAGNCYPTLKIATKIRDIRKKLMEIAARNPVNWDNQSQDKYYLYSDLADCSEVYQSDRTRTYCLGIVYSADKHFLKTCNDEIGKDNLIWYYKYNAGMIDE